MHFLRPLLKSRTFALLSIATIALGLGATTAVFSVFESLLLRGRPGIVDEQALVDIGRTQDGAGFDNFGWQDYLDYRDQSTVFTGIAGMRFDLQPAGLSVNGEAQSSFVQWVSPNFLLVLGARPTLGRDFTQSDRPAAEIVLSHRYWQRRFNSDPAVVGRSVLFNNKPVTIVGVTAPGFEGSGLLAADFWAPMPLTEILDPTSTLLKGRGNSFMMGIGRLKPGATLQQAQAELSLIASRIAKAFPKSHTGRGVAVAPSGRFPGEMRQIVTVASSALFVLCALALVVVCANVAGLLLARGLARRRELAVRSALGATRGRLIAQLLGENVALFLAGGAAGGLVALWLVALFSAVLPRLPFPIAAHPTVNFTLFAFALGVALLVGLVFGFGPALNATRFDVLASLRSNEQPVGARLFSLRNLFLVVQLALSLALITTAGLLAKGLGVAAQTNAGFDPERVEYFNFDLTTGGLTDATGRAFTGEFRNAVAALPGVESAAWSNAIPLDNSGRGFGALWRAGVARVRENQVNTDWNLVSPDYFSTLRIPLVAGRAFSDSDVANSPLVAVVNETFARRLWPNLDAVGQSLVNDEGQSITIIGVARDAKYRSLGEAPRSHLFVPFAQLYHHDMTLFVRTRDAQSVAPQVRALLSRLRPGLPITRVESLATFVATSLLPYRIAGAVAMSAGSLALILAALGVYGSTLYWATQRTREFGIRLALGSTRAQLITLVLRGSFAVAAIAVLLGLAASLGLGQVVRSFLFNVSAVDPFTFIAAASIFLALVLLAAWLPARRATKVDPMSALRAE